MQADKTIEKNVSLQESGGNGALRRLIKGNQPLILVTLVIILMAIFLLSFVVGRYGIPLTELLNIFFSKIFGLEQTWSGTVETVLLI